MSPEMLAALGMRPMHGELNVWAERGSLPTQVQMIADLQGRLDEATAHLARVRESVSGIVAYIEAAAAGTL